jgi:Flp pilus assembly protein TadD, contains TPR repeats
MFYETFVDLSELKARNAHMKNTLFLFCFLYFSSFMNAQEADSAVTLQEREGNAISLDSVFVSKGDKLNEYISSARYKEAISFLDSLEFQDKNTIMQKVFCFQSLNNYRKAIEILLPIKEEYPEDTSIKLQLLLCYESINEYKKGGEVLGELIALHPDNSYFQVRKGDLFYRDDQPKAALAIYKEINEYDPVYLNKRIGMCFEKTGQTDSAGVYYTKAWKADPLDSFSALSLVKIQLKEQKYEAALLNSEIYLQNNPDNLQMKILNAYSYYNLNNYEEAITRFEHCRELGDSSLITARGLGISYYFLENDSLAYSNLSAAYAMDTTNSIVLHALGQTAFKVKIYPEAVESYKTLLDRIKVDNNLYYTYHRGLADSYNELGDYQNATSNYLLCMHYTSDLERTMELNFFVAMIAEEKLNDLSTAIFYHTQYFRNLGYYKTLIEEKEDAPPETLEELNFKIDELTKHIESLKSQDTTIKWNN